MDIPGLKCAQLIGNARTAASVIELIPMEVTFGTAGGGFVRLNFATSPAILREIVQRVEGVVQ